MNRSRRIEALRNLAERPGTTHEGNVARAMLAKAEAKPQTDHEYFSSYIGNKLMDDLLKILLDADSELG